MTLVCTCPALPAPIDHRPGYYCPEYVLRLREMAALMEASDD